MFTLVNAVYIALAIALIHLIIYILEKLNIKVWQKIQRIFTALTFAILAFRYLLASMDQLPVITRRSIISHKQVLWYILASWKLRELDQDVTKR